MNNEKDTETCIGCEKEFPHEQISTSSGEPMCEQCEKEMAQEVYQAGVKKLDEYLEARGLKQDFNIFCCAKWSDITEEEYVDLDENADEDYERWTLHELKQKASAPIEQMKAKEFAVYISERGWFYHSVGKWKRHNKSGFDYKTTEELFNQFTNQKQ